MQKIWICGANGQLGRAINGRVERMKYEMLNTDIGELNIADTDDVLRFGEMNRPEIIINCAGMTDLQACEKEKNNAYLVNALGARNLSIIARKLEAKLVQISTDDVFDGRSQKPYNEFDTANPVTVYGKSKLAGENFVKEFTYKHFIIRSTWVYGEGDNFVRRLIKKAGNGGTIPIAADEFGSPTSAKELAAFILHLIRTSEYGTYHATNQGICSRLEFAREILRLTGIKAKLLAVPAKESGFSAVRPDNAVLDNFIMELIHIFEFPQWQVSLEEYIKEGKWK